MSDEETPLQELIRTASEVANPLYFSRSENASRIPYAMMERLRKAIKRIESGG